MIIVGAKGFAKEVLEICYQNGIKKGLVFYDDISTDLSDKLFGRFLILKEEKEVKEHFLSHGNSFTLGLGNPHLRYSMKQKFENLGGKITSTISQKSEIGYFGVNIGAGCNIMAGSLISNDVVMGEGCILYFNSIVTHDCVIGDYVEISPGAIILGRANIGSYSRIGAGSKVLPDINIGKNVIIGAGAVVTKDIPDNSVAVGLPARVIKKNS